MRDAESLIQELPEPPEAAQAHSQALRERIARAIEAEGGFLGFRRYMHMALYEPGLGYYAGGARKFGAAGDFVTAPEVSPIFSRCLARQCLQVLAAVGGGDILELGAGSGVMAAEVLAELRELDALPQRYLILEVSPELRERQAATLHDQVPDLADRVHWLQDLPAGLRGVVLANEVLDAMPVDCFAVRELGIQERGVGLEDGDLTWRERPAGERLHGEVQHILRDLPEPLPLGYESELNPHVDGWIARLGEALEAGAAFILDYGYPRREYYHMQRARGTLLCHYRHRAHDNPFVWPGLQDITASVDFTAVAEAADRAGLAVSGYTTQAAFLMGSGLDEVYQQLAGDRPGQLAELSQQIKRLTLPSEMGERFHAMALTRDLPMALRGFAVHDHRGRL